MNSKIFGDFYNPTKALSYGRPWILCVGSRSVGKSTGWMIYAIDHYLKTGKKFLYIRRTDDEVKHTASSACDNAVTILKANGAMIYDIQAKRGNFYIRLSDVKEDKGSVCGAYIALSQAYKYKSANFSDYDIIIYDEFMVTDSARYLGNANNPLYEYEKCLELYQTVDRGIGMASRNETKFIFIANTATYYSPIFIGLGVDRYITPDAKFIAPKGLLWVCEQIRGVKATENIMTSNSAQLSSEQYRNYSYNADTLLDGSDLFVVKLKCPMQAYLTFSYRGNIMGVYYIKDQDLIYISSKPNKLKPIALTVGDQGGIDYSIVQKPSISVPMKRIYDYMLKGRVMFESKRIKAMLGTYMKLVPSFS